MNTIDITDYDFSLDKPLQFDNPEILSGTGTFFASNYMYIGILLLFILIYFGYKIYVKKTMNGDQNAVDCTGGFCNIRNTSEHTQ